MSLPPIRLNKDLREEILSRIMTRWEINAKVKKQIESTVQEWLDELVQIVEDEVRLKMKKLLPHIDAIKKISETDYDNEKEGIFILNIANKTLFNIVFRDHHSSSIVSANNIDLVYRENTLYRIDGSVYPKKSSFLDKYYFWMRFLAKKESDYRYTLKLDSPQVIAWANKAESVAQTKNTFYLYQDKVRGILESVKTIKQLLELWPEVKDFIPTEVMKPSAMHLPMVPIDEINKELGLTPLVLPEKLPAKKK